MLKTDINYHVEVTASSSWTYQLSWLSWDSWRSWETPVSLQTRRLAVFWCSFVCFFTLPFFGIYSYLIQLKHNQPAQPRLYILYQLFFFVRYLCAIATWHSSGPWRSILARKTLAKKNKDETTSYILPGLWQSGLKRKGNYSSRILTEG